MFNGTMGLNPAIPTVVVCKDQSFGGYYFGGTSSSKDNYGIFQAGVIDAIDFLSSQLQSHFLHICIVKTFDQHRQPHPLVGFKGWFNAKHDEGKDNKR